MLAIVLLLLFFVISLGPLAYVRWIMRRYATNLDYVPGNGSQLAQHLLHRFHLDHVKVVKDQSGDFYDPTTHEIHLSNHNYHAKSLTAITVAAHECGHAIQHYRHSRLFKLRGNIVNFMRIVSPIATVCIISSSILLAIQPRLAIIGIATVLLIRLTELALHLVTLPVELDASFNIALPILRQGQYLQHKDISNAKRILRAAAMTYVSIALSNLMLVWRSLVFKR